MPSSLYQGKEQIAKWISASSDINTVLDVGCGEGTYPKILREKFNILTQATWWGVEVWPAYIQEFELEKLYDKLLNEDIRLIDWSSLPKFDLVIFGDILEHMTKEESQAVIDNALKHSKFCVISIPVVRMKQGAVGGNPYEIHVKDNWSHDEVLSSFPNIQHSYVEGKIGVYWLANTL